MSLRTPKTRFEFEENMSFLLEAIHKKSFQMNSSLHRSAKSLERVRLLPNHRVDLLTVDEMSRLQANTIATFSMNKKELNGYPEE